MVMCCIPQEIVQCSFPEILDTNSAVQVFCSNPFCWQSGLLHSSCFYKWEVKVVKYLVSEERNKINIDRRVMDSLLWTKQMWDLPLPASLTACKCGEGGLKRLFEDEKYAELEPRRNVDSLVSGVLSKTRQGPGGGAGDWNCKGWSEKGSALAESAVHVEGSWEVVSRAKPKKDVKAVEKSYKRSSKPPAEKLVNPKTPTAGPDPVKAFQPGQAEGRRDSDGLIHCCSCKTVHTSLPDFIKHCKTNQHTKQVLGDINSNNARSGRNDEILDLRREVNHLKNGLVEVLKQGWEKDISVTWEFDQFKEKCITELNQKDAVMALLIEKFQGLEEKCLKVDEKMASMDLLAKSNETDIDTCFDRCQDLTQHLTELSKDHKSFKKMIQSAQEKLDVKVKDINVGAVSEVSSSILLVDIDHKKSVKEVAIIGRNLVLVVSLFVVFAIIVLAITWL